MQLVARLTQEPEDLGSISCQATYFHFSSADSEGQLATACAQSTG